MKKTKKCEFGLCAFENTGACQVVNTCKECDYGKLAIRALDTTRWLEQDSNWSLWMCEQCGYEFNLESGTPEENQINYCPQCGRKIVEYVQRVDDTEEDW